jgi:hypothetical protein
MVTTMAVVGGVWPKTSSAVGFRVSGVPMAGLGVVVQTFVGSVSLLVKFQVPIVKAKAGTGARRNAAATPIATFFASVDKQIIGASQGNSAWAT